jgi:hypothetical protein
VEPQNLYERDFYAWTQQQAQLLRERAWEKLDLPHLIEEMESLGRQQRQELRNRLGVLVGHLLKWEYQPQARSVSWLLTLQVQRQEVLDLLEESPSLRPLFAGGHLQVLLEGAAAGPGRDKAAQKDFSQDLSLFSRANPG